MERITLKEFLLLEYRDWLEQRTLGKYGAWIDTKNREVHYVKQYGHEKFIMDLVKSQGGNDETVLGRKTYDYAFSHGFVRIVFEGTVLSVEGKRKDLEEAATIIMSTLNSPPQIRYVQIESVDGQRRTSFKIPTERWELGQYLGLD